MIGTADAVPGYQFALDKFGEQVDGTYRVEHARHEFSKHGYRLGLKAVRVAKKAPQAPAKQVGSAAVKKAPARHWLEIHLVDEQGAPAAGAAYVVKTGSGQELVGKLDDGGRARLDGLDPGTCEVKFPGHNDSWRPA